MKKIGFLKMIYLYSVFWWCVKFKNTCWPINNSSKQTTNKQTKIMGLRMPAGLLCALPKQTNQQIHKSELNINHTMNHRSIFFKNNNFHPILWPQQQPFFEFSTYILTMWTVNEVHTVLQTAFQKEIRRRKQRIKNKALEKQNKVVDPRFEGALFFRASL